MDLGAGLQVLRNCVTIVCVEGHYLSHWVHPHRSLGTTPPKRNARPLLSTCTFIATLSNSTPGGASGANVSFHVDDAFIGSNTTYGGGVATLDIVSRPGGVYPVEAPAAGCLQGEAVFAVYDATVDEEASEDLLGGLQDQDILTEDQAEAIEDCADDDEEEYWRDGFSLRRG